MRRQRHHIRRLLAPTVALYQSGLVLISGIFLFSIGFLTSFNMLLLPGLKLVSEFWAFTLLQFISSESIGLFNHILAGLGLVIGTFLIYRGSRMLFRSLVETFNPSLKGTPKMTNIYVKRLQLSRGLKIVALGGGTGLSTLLRGLKQHSSNITAIVTVTDDGGSSGKLVQEMGILPPGDIRNCLVALADAEKIMTDLFQHRFKNESGSLSGHSVGNLLIAGLFEQSGGDFQKALDIASEVLAIRGRVIPSTFNHVRLRAIMGNGEELWGETNIVNSEQNISRVFLFPESPLAHPEAIKAIEEADLISMGPGSLYTSIIPNLLVPQIAQALSRSNAIRAYICNVMTQPGETDQLTAAEHVAAIQANIGQKVFDYVLVNVGVPSGSALEKYKLKDKKIMVEPDFERIRAMGYRVILGNFISESDHVRHDPLRVANYLTDLCYKE